MMGKLVKSFNTDWLAYLGLLLIFLAGCGVSLESTTKLIVDELTRNKEVFKNRKIAMIDIVILETGKTTPLTKVISENINTELIDRIATLQGMLLERSQIAAIMKEYKFQFSDLADPNTAKELGKALGADLIVVGTLSESLGQLNVRIVDIESYGIVAGARQTLSNRSFSTKRKKIVAVTSTNYWQAFSLTGIIGAMLVLVAGILRKIIGESTALKFCDIITVSILILVITYSISSIQDYSTWQKVIDPESAWLAYAFGVLLYSVLFLIELLIL